MILLVAYLAMNTRGDPLSQSIKLQSLYYCLGVISPGVSLARSLFIASNISGVTCRGREIAQNPGAMDVYGGPIVYLSVQSFSYFLILILKDSGLSIGQWLSFLGNYSPQQRDDGGSAIEMESGLSQRGSRMSRKDGLQVAHLTKTFKSHVAVNDVSFHAPKGECFALLGPNGAGKTTCISMIRGDILPSTPESTISVEGIDALKHRSRARAQIASVLKLIPLMQ